MRQLKGYYKHFLSIVGIAMVLYTIASVTVYPMDPWLFRATHLTLALILIFWLVPARKDERSLRLERPSPVDLILTLVSIVVLIYLYVEFKELIYRVAAIPSTADIVIGIVISLLVLEASRRTAGIAFSLLAIAAVMYTFVGQYLPGILSHKGYSVGRTISYILSTEGIYGSTLSAAASFAILFITLGAFLKVFGAADFFNDFAMAISGHTRGGPAKVAVIGSSLFGTISGHAAGNVATTGTFTIPLMKQTGYKPSFAGAVEAVASTGGQILPPIMGTVAFVMIEITAIPYGEIVTAALLPAILYYIAVFFMVDFEAVNMNLTGLPREKLPSLKTSLKSGYFFVICIMVLLYFLFIKESSVSAAAIYTIISVVIISIFSIRNPQEIVAKVFEALYAGAVGTMKLTPLTAAAGIVIAVISLTGIGIKLGSFLISVSGGNMFLILFFAMLLTLILGMGMSTIPAYVIAAVVVAPALIDLGIPMLQAHLFVLYFACLSTITPPIAISAFTAAGIADAPAMETGFKAAKLAVVGFIVPFLFVYRPSLIAQGSIEQIAYACIISIIAVYNLSRGLQLKTISWVERGLLVAGALVLLFPNEDWIGLTLIAASYVMYYYFKNRRKKPLEKNA